MAIVYTGKKERDPFVDILKAVGIISIVIGHSSEILPSINFKIGPFVYTYHIMIFLFASGFCFKKCHAENPYEYIGIRLKRIFPTYIAYSISFVFLHNFMKDLHMIPSSAEQYGVQAILTGIANTFTMVETEGLLGTFWFIPMFLLAMIMFCFLFSIAEKCRYPLVVHVFFIVVSGGLGIYANTMQMYWNYHLQTSFLGIPVIYFGYFIKCNWSRVKHFFNVGTACISGIVIYWILSLNIGIIELTVDYIMSPLLFYPVTVLGVIFCAGLAKVLCRNKWVGGAFAFIGKNSYHIMALHFLFFKIVDVIYRKIIGTDYYMIEVFPHAFDLVWVYWIAGIMGPLLFLMGSRVIGKYIKKVVVSNKTENN